MIEIIGVVAVLAVMTALATANYLKRMDLAARTRETGDLNTLSNALVMSVLGNKAIPTVVNLPSAMAQFLALPVRSVTNNVRNYGRVFLVDPNLQIGGGGLPFVQGAAGIAAPANARVMILSTISRALPVTSGIPSSNDFYFTWNTPTNTKPALAAWTSWPGKGEDLCFQRLDLAPLFHRLLLVNADTVATARYAIETNTITSLPPMGANSQVLAYYLDGTALNCYYTNDVLQLRQVLRQDESFIFQNGRWDRGFTSPTDDENGEFAYWVALFLQPPAPPTPKFASGQQPVINEFYDFLIYYVLWAFGTPPMIPPFQGIRQANAPQYPPYAVLNGAQTCLGNSTYYLIH